MYITTDILADVLEKNYRVMRCGNSIQNVELDFPVLFEKDMPLESGGLYIANATDLPASCETACVFICVGRCPKKLTTKWIGSILAIHDPAINTVSLFNYVQRYFSKVSAWAHRMHELLETGANIKEYVLASMELFGNGISIVDHNLQVLATCFEAEKDGERVLMINTQFDRVTSDFSADFNQTYMHNTSIREPFSYKGQNKYPEIEHYCINLYFGDAYMGCCTLFDCMKPMCESDFAMFQVFAGFIRQALKNSSVLATSNIVTMKTIFNSVLQALPISKENLKIAIQFLRRNMQMCHETFQGWYCMVLSSADTLKALPEQYICMTVEDILPHTVAIAKDGHIVMLCAISDRSTMEDTFCRILLPYLKEMNFRAAVSTQFHDIFKAINYYKQTLNTLELGSKADPDTYIYHFQNYALSHLLNRASLECSPEYLLTEGLQKLRAASNSVDYWDTLKQFLDNECNAAETARKMFLHRSTLLARLEKIRRWVDIDSPDSKIYLRIMTRLLSDS